MHKPTNSDWSIRYKNIEPLTMMASSNGNIYVLLDLCSWNSPVTCEFPVQRPATWSFDVFFDLRLNKRLSKQSQGWWLEMSLRSLCHCNDCRNIDTQAIGLTDPAPKTPRRRIDANLSHESRELIHKLQQKISRQNYSMQHVASSSPQQVPPGHRHRSEWSHRVVRLWRFHKSGAQIWNRGSHTWQRIGTSPDTPPDHLCATAPFLHIHSSILACK